MKRQTVRNIISSICFIIVFVFAFSKVSVLLERKNSRIGYSEFWEEPEGYDVWLLGTSHMRQGVQAVELYGEYKIASYCLASTSNPIPQTYWTFVNALQYAEPKVVVMDCFHVVKDGKTPEKEMNMHNGMDSIPFSLTKVQMVNDLFEEREKRIEHLFDFYIYHNRWDQLGANDLSPKKSLLKGGVIISKIQDMSAYSVVDETDMCGTDSLGYEYLRRIIEKCQEKKIPLVLTAIPCCVGDEEQRGMNAVAKVAEEYHVPFLNMIYRKELPIDFQVDFHDEGHLNWAGGQKSTRYIGKYLIENFPSLRDGVSKETARDWDAHYLAYKKQKIQWLKGESRIDRFLLRLYDDDFSCDLYQREEKEQDIVLEKLLAQIPDLHRMTYEEAASVAGANPEMDFAVVVRDKESEKIVDTAVFKDGKREKKKRR
ncbi:MAG: hypothetical protein HFH60_11135 [Lachnospiraceae bacterium]|nr:hypothetical protein [Lachnospiraceae bacterium]